MKSVNSSAIPTWQDSVPIRGLLKAVQLNFIVIGEAATRISDEVQQQFAGVPWPLMRAMRNRLVHVYFQVDPRIVWETAVNDLPPLAVELRKILSDLKAESGQTDEPTDRSDSRDEQSPH